MRIRAFQLTINSLQLTIDNYGKISRRGTRTCDIIIVLIVKDIIHNFNLHKIMDGAVKRIC